MKVNAKSSTANFIGIAPQFRVSDIVKTAEYYSEKFGFNDIEYLANPPVFASVKRDEVEIQLKLDHSAALTAKERKGWDAYIWVDDIFSLAEEFRGRGAQIIEGPVERPYGCVEIVVIDCNGFKIAFGS